MKRKEGSTKKDLYKIAKELGIKGRSTMSKEELEITFKIILKETQ
jgi:hypothetical protein